MHLFLLSVFVSLAVPLRVLACEGDCITGTTTAICDRYKHPVARAVDKIGEEIIHTFKLALPGSTVSPPSLMKPIMDCHSNNSWSAMRQNIFPGRFHGKCLDHNGNEPAGCPNPNCPIICGTPGSMVHFYSIFVSIAYNTTCSSFMSCADPNSESYRALEKRVTTHMPESRLQTGSGPQILRYRRPSVIEDEKPAASPIARKDIRSALTHILAKFPEALAECCGGSDLSSCTWAREMKTHILSYP
ncbi:hypothetical protein MVEN_02635100 [Mycena venus]|uniref:Uncharacterized protein n=1 Tax=Mycena venus TaxID=2733690 RepID=A0A8H6WTN5_9AGAR|nr:hypothetical protein MVEN_02635100 [Mycena venus]